MAIPNPLANLGMFKVAGAAVLFLIASRFLSVYPILYFLKNGNRVSLLTAINLSQLSEFALVITVIGVKAGHIVPDIQTIITYVFCDHFGGLHLHDQIQPAPPGLCEPGPAPISGSRILRAPPPTKPRDPVRTSPSWDFSGSPAPSSGRLKRRRRILKTRSWWWILIPEVVKIALHGIKVVYGDISNPETLHHAGIGEAKIVISTISDEILVGTDNLRLVGWIKKMAPEARIIATAESPSRALDLFNAGADYVYLPNQLAAQHLLYVVERLPGRTGGHQGSGNGALRERDEVMG